MPTAQELQALLSKTKTKVDRLNGQREQIVKTLKEMGHETPASLKKEIDELQEFLRVTEPGLAEQYNDFYEQYGDLIKTL